MDYRELKSEGRIPYITLLKFEMVIQTSENHIQPSWFEWEANRYFTNSVSRQPSKLRWIDGIFQLSHGDQNAVHDVENDLLLLRLRRELLLDRELLRVSYEQYRGSIIIKDGEIKIKSTWIIVVIALITGGLDFLKNYEQYKKGYQSLVSDLQPILTEVGAKLPDCYISELNAKLPPQDAVFDELQEIFRREDPQAEVNSLLRRIHDRRL